MSECVCFTASFSTIPNLHCGDTRHVLHTVYPGIQVGRDMRDEHVQYQPGYFRNPIGKSVGPTAYKLPDHTRVWYVEWRKRCHADLGFLLWIIISDDVAVGINVKNTCVGSLCWPIAACQEEMCPRRRFELSRVRYRVLGHHLTSHPFSLKFQKVFTLIVRDICTLKSGPPKKRMNFYGKHLFIFPFLVYYQIRHVKK